MAIYSPVLGILGIWPIPLGSLLGLILGIVAAVRIRKSGGRLRGRYWANTGIAVSAVVILLYAMIFGPVYASMLSPADIRNLLSVRFMEEVGSAFSSHMDDHDGTLPSVDNWTDAVRPYLVHPDRHLHADLDEFIGSPDNPEDGPAYAMNIHLDALRLSDVARPDRTVLLFEVDPGSPLAGGPTMLPGKPRHRDGYVIVFVDGTARNVPLEQIHRRLRWVP